MAKRPLVENLGNLNNESSAVQTINENVNKLADSLKNLLSTTDLTDNTMNVSLDMNGQRIINLPTPSLANDPIRLKDLLLYILGLPPGPQGPKGDPGAGGTFSTLADAISNPNTPDFMEIAGYAKPGDGGAGLYVKVATQPTHKGKFQHTKSGSWYELREQTIVPEMFGAFGTPSNGAYKDEWAQLQAAADYAMYYGCTLRFDGLSGTRGFDISQTLRFNATRSPATLNFNPAMETDQNDPNVEPSAHFSNHPEVKIENVGNCQIRAIASMPQMILLDYDYTAPGSLQPYWSKLLNLKLNGNNLAARGIKGVYIYRIDIVAPHIYGVQDGIVLDHVGVSDISKFLIYCKGCAIDGTLCADLQVHDGEFWPIGIGIRAGLNTRIYSNTFTAWKLNNALAVATRGILIENTLAGQDYGVRDVDIFGNEFCDFDIAIYARDGSTDAQKDVYSIRAWSNHVIRTFRRPNAQFCYFDGVRGFSLTDNHSGDRDWEAPRTTGYDMAFNNCLGGSIKGGTLARSTVGSINISNSRGIVVDGVTFDNIARGTAADGPGCVEVYDSYEIGVVNCIISNFKKEGGYVAGSEHVSIEFGVSDNNRFVGCLHPTGWITPYYVRGLNSKFGNDQPQRLPRAIADLPNAYFVPAGTELLVTNGAGGLAKVFAHPSGVWKYVATEANV